MSTLAVKLTWDRLGRKDPGNPRRDGFEEIITIPDHCDGNIGRDLYEAIYRIARKHLASSDFAVHVFDYGTFAIEGGRFGEGRWEIVTTVSDGASDG